MRTLDEVAVPLTDKSSKAHDYCRAYESLFDQDMGALLEVGVHAGRSLQMWAEWLPDADVIGVDIDPDATRHMRYPLEDGGGYLAPFPHGVTAVCCDAKVYVPPFTLDVIIDDGSHMASDMSATFRQLWPYLRPGGFYAIEDWQFQWEWAQDDHSAFDLVDAQLRSLLSGRERDIPDVCELHVYPELTIVRKTPS